MGLHKPQDAQSRGTTRGHPQHQQGPSRPHSLPTSACTSPEGAEGGTGKPPPEKEDTEAGEPHPPTSRKQPNSPIHPTSAHPRGKGKGGKRGKESHYRAAAHPPHQGRQTPSQATPKATPMGPADRTPRGDAAQTEDGQPEKSAQYDHTARKGPRKRNAGHAAGEEAGHWPRGHGQISGQ